MYGCVTKKHARCFIIGVQIVCSSVLIFSVNRLFNNRLVNVDISHFSIAKDLGMPLVNNLLFFYPSEYHSSIPMDSIPLYLQSAKLSLGSDGFVQEISSLIKKGGAVPFPTENSTLEIELASLGKFETFEYKWKSSGDPWQRTNSPQIKIQSLPKQPDELLIKAFGEFGLVSEILSIPFYWEHKDQWIRYLLQVLVAAVLLMLLYYFVGIRKVRRRENTAMIENGKDEQVNLTLPKPLIQPNNEFKTKLEAIIFDHISTPEFGVNELSEAFCICRKSLYRKIKKHTGQNPNEYIRNFRLEYARKLLATPELNISDITFKAGFSSTSYFSNCYKKHFGLSPKEDRKRLNVN